ncbi:MAG: hypothetical protein IT375_14695 [Polyangiaceae bacterium]|nr:hypothetical protein [Polyangiaceae bacterium]
MANGDVRTAISASPDVVEVNIQDSRSNATLAFCELTAPQQEELAREAWKVGLRALLTAYSQAQEARLTEIGVTLREDLDRELKAHVERTERAVLDALGRYLDPENGQLHVLLSEGGALAQQLRRHVGADGSVLADTLAKLVGENSVLFRKLSPTESGGLVQVLATAVEGVLQSEHGQLQKALDPSSGDGAMAKLVRALQETVRLAGSDQAERLKAALSVLDANDPTSPLSQMRKETQQAREALLQAINPAAENSPLALLQRTLTLALQEHTKNQQETLAAARKEQLEFQQEMRESIQRIELRRTDLSRTSRGGVVFQDAAVEAVQHMLGGAFLVEDTGNVVGTRANCKTGDALITFPPDHGFAGSKVVIEAKRDKTYGVSRALVELAQARENRGACAGIFVMARSHAPAGFPRFVRYGVDVLVVWDEEDPSSDLTLEAALMVGVALATRRSPKADDADLQALARIEQRVAQEVERLERIRDAAEKIRKQTETIEKEVATGSKKLGSIVKDAKKTLAALDVELDDDELERETPVEFPEQCERLGLPAMTGTDK